MNECQSVEWQLNITSVNMDWTCSIVVLRKLPTDFIWFCFRTKEQNKTKQRTNTKKNIRFVKKKDVVSIFVYAVRNCWLFFLSKIHRNELLNEKPTKKTKFPKFFAVQYEQKQTFVQLLDVFVLSLLLFS